MPTAQPTDLPTPTADQLSRVLTLPNAVTTVRLLCIPLFLWLLFGAGRQSAAAILLGQGTLLTSRFGARLGIFDILALLMLVFGIGSGIINPAANNACIELMPEKVATIVGLRGMFRITGGVSGVCFSTLVLSLSSGSNTGFKIVFNTLGIVLLSAIPLIFLMPAGRGRWRAARDP